MDRLSVIREMEAYINNGTNENEFDCRVHILYDDLMELWASSALITTGSPFASPRNHAPSGNTATFGVPDPHAPPSDREPSQRLETPELDPPAPSPRRSPPSDREPSQSPTTSEFDPFAPSPSRGPSSDREPSQRPKTPVLDPPAPSPARSLRPDSKPSQRTPELDPPAPSPHHSLPSEREPSHRPTTPEFDDPFVPSPSRGPPSDREPSQRPTTPALEPSAPSPSRGPSSDRELSQRPKTPSLGTPTPSPPHNPPATSEPPSQPKSPELENWRQDAISMVAKAKFTNSSLRFYDDGKTVVECSRAMLEDLLGKVTAETLKDLEFARDFLIFATKVFGMPGIKSLQKTVALLRCSSGYRQGDLIMADGSDAAPVEMHNCLHLLRHTQHVHASLLNTDFLGCEQLPRSRAFISYHNMEPWEQSSAVTLTPWEQSSTVTLTPREQSSNITFTHRELSFITVAVSRVS
ncbi:hypothetical protein BC567DRAFT_259927 [Phyllosticta citribraziliensis]